MPTGGSNHASTAVDNKIYVVANNIYTSDEKETRGLLVYDVKNDSWSQGTPAPSIVIDGPAVATAGVIAPKRIYVLGVQLGNNPPPTNYVYDPESDKWTAGATMRTNRVDFGAAVVDDKLYAIGGYTFDNSPNNGKVTVSAVNEQYTPFGFGTVPPAVHVFSPENKDYTSSSVSLAFMVNKPVVWLGYSLDGQETVTITGNTTIAGLTNGLHNVTVYAKDAFENTGASETIAFTVAKSEPFPTTLVIASIGSVAIVGLGLLIYLKKRQKGSVDKGVKLES
jgi:hypothetical protein